MPSDALIEKRIRSLRRLLAAEGRSLAEIDDLLAGPPARVVAEWDRFQSMPRAERDRLYARFAALRNEQRRSRKYERSAVLPIPISESSSESVRPASEPVRPGRGPGRAPAGVPFSLVIPPDLLDRLRQRAYSDQRSVAGILRLAAEAYLAN